MTRVVRVAAAAPRQGRLRSLICAICAICGLFAGGCVVVGRVAPLPPPAPPPPVAPEIEYALGEVSFQMNDGEVAPSYFDARLMAAAIFAEWERRGYIAEAREIDLDELAAGTVTISGAVRAETSFWAQLLNAVTLLLVPYPVTTHYDLALTVAPAPGRPAATARASSSERTWVGLLLVFGAPFAERGHDQEVTRLADALYPQLKDSLPPPRGDAAVR